MLKDILELIFTSVLFFNAMIFIPQAMKIFKEKTAKDVSMWTFLGFLITQFFIVLHGIFFKDYVLAAGYFLSMLTCGTVIVLIFIFRRNKKNINNEINGISPRKNNFDQIGMVEKIIALMPGHVYWVDKEGFYLGCNNKQAKSAGLSSREEIVGKRNKDLPWNFNVGVIPEKLDSINREVIQTGQAICVEEPAILIDGTKKIFLSSKVPIFDDSEETIGMVGISIDITDEKNTQSLLKRANDARRELISTASHELRNSIGNVIVSEQLLEENLTTIEDMIPQSAALTASSYKFEFNVILKNISEAMERSNVITDEANHALSSLKNLGNLHYLQLNGIEANLEFFNIQKLLSISTQRITYKNTKNLKIHQSISPLLTQDVFIDAQNIIMALSIIIGNAFRFSDDEGQIIINVEIVENDNGQLIVISVQDFGVGMHQKPRSFHEQNLHK